jgi:hypothetical protein
VIEGVWGWGRSCLCQSRVQMCSVLSMVLSLLLQVVDEVKKNRGDEDGGLRGGLGGVKGVGEGACGEVNGGDEGG